MRARPTSARPRMQAGDHGGPTRIRYAEGRHARASAWEDLSSVAELEWEWDARAQREPAQNLAPHDDDALDRLSPPPVAPEHRNIMQVAESSLATAHAARRHAPSLSGPPGGARELRLAGRAEQAAARMSPRRMTRKKSRSPDREIAWAASTALVAELEAARDLLRDSHDRGAGDSEDSVNALSPVIAAPGARPPRRGPSTPPLLQRPLATDYDEDPLQRGRREYAPGSEVLPAVRLGPTRKGSANSRKHVSSAAFRGKAKGLKAQDELLPSSMRKDALKRSVEAIESLSLALDSVNEEKKVLLRVLEACKTSESVAKTGPHAEKGEVRSRPAQACYIAQMLPGVDPMVVERMPFSAIEAIEAALALKLSHAQGAAKLVEMQIRPGGFGLQAAVEPRVDKMREDLEELRAENEQLRLNLMESTQGLMARGAGTSSKGNGPALVISFLQKDIAAAKAKILVLQTEAASSEVRAHQVAQKAEEEKEMLRREIVSLHARLEAFRATGTQEGAGDASASGKAEETTDFSRVVPTSCEISLTGDTQNTRGISAAASVRYDHESGAEGAMAASQSMLSAVLKEFSSQLANNYSQVRSALHGAATEEDGAFVVDLVKRLLSLISSFDAQIQYLQTTEGALSLRAKQQSTATGSGIFRSVRPY